MLTILLWLLIGIPALMVITLLLKSRPVRTAFYWIGKIHAFFSAGGFAILIMGVIILSIILSIIGVG